MCIFKILQSKLNSLKKAKSKEYLPMKNKKKIYLFITKVIVYLPTNK